MTKDCEYMQSLRERFASRNIEISLANDSLPIVRLTNPHASAVVSLYGAHIFAYVPRGSRNVLWLSSESNFTPGKPVRGGIPVCWPWFGPGPEEGMPAHGLARISLWNLEKIEENSDGSTTLTLTLDKSAEIELISQPEDNPELRFCLLLKIDSLFPRVGEGDPDTQLGSCLNVESGNRIVLDQ